MNATPTIFAGDNPRLADSLNQVLADSHALMALTQARSHGLRDSLPLAVRFK